MEIALCRDAFYLFLRLIYFCILFIDYVTEAFYVSRN